MISCFVPQDEPDNSSGDECGDSWFTLHEPTLLNKWSMHLLGGKTFWILLQEVHVAVPMRR